MSVYLWQGVNLVQTGTQRRVYPVVLTKKCVWALKKWNQHNTQTLSRLGLRLIDPISLNQDFNRQVAFPAG